MTTADWIVLALTLFIIVAYGIWKSRNTKNIETYLLADKKLPWYHVGLSVMATQASAITFLSAPGQAYSDGMRFVQFYFGLPLAMVLLCITFVPIFHRLKVFTAYEFLEKRFDNKTRTLTAFLFLLQRGISTGITIYAPALVLSTILHIDITITTLIMGGLVIIYTVYGGTRAVSYTQLLQMTIIFAGLIFAGIMVIVLLPPSVGFTEALHIAGKMGKLNVIDTTFDPSNRYNVWSGIIGGFFLQLSYFGTDQSQVGRYLTGSSVSQSRLGLIMNGLVKIPMQFFILLIGTLVFTFYQFNQPPLFFNQVEADKVKNSEHAEEYLKLENDYIFTHSLKEEPLQRLVAGIKSGSDSEVEEAQSELQRIEREAGRIRSDATALMSKGNPEADTNDTNYIFLSFVTGYLPAGLVGLLIAIIFLASMGSTASGMNSLASTTVIDIYKRLIKHDDEERNYLNPSRLFTVAWGLFCVLVALFASRLGNLIEAVNILGSLFYGTILGIFIVAFYLKKVHGTAVFYAALIVEAFVVLSWKIDLTAYLWLNVSGCILVMAAGFLFEAVTIHRRPWFLLATAAVMFSFIYISPGKADSLFPFMDHLHLGTFPSLTGIITVLAALFGLYLVFRRNIRSLPLARLHISLTILFFGILSILNSLVLAWIFSGLLIIIQLIFLINLQRRVS